MNSNHAQYTVELRKIRSVFDFDYDFYDEQFRCDFEDKFLDYYAFDEIGFETIERFKHNLRAHLNLNMPLWEKLYETELATEGIDFLRNKDYREEFERVVDTIDNLKGSASSRNDYNNKATSTNTSNSTNNSDHKESSIGDGVASASLNYQYLTGVSGDKNSTTNSSNSSGTNNGNSNTSANNTEDKTGNLKEKTILTAKGNIGVVSGAELLEKWRKVLLNIDKTIIKSCRHLFMGVY